MSSVETGRNHRGDVAGGSNAAWKAVFSPANRQLLLAVTGLLAVIFVFVGSNVAANHDPKPHGLPVGIVGSPAAAAGIGSQLNRGAPSAFTITTYASPAAARTAIMHRAVYGAFDPGPPPVLMVAGAASRAVATLLQQTFQAAAPDQRLVVRDLVPLPASDSGGAAAFSAVLSLVVTGVMGASVIYVVTRRRALAVRLAALIVAAVGGGAVTALVTNVVVGAFSGQFLAIWGVATLLVLAISLPVAACQVLLGLPGIAIGLVAFSVVGTPSSGGGTAPELLPDPWRAISQGLPPGAGVTAMRDVVYFHSYGATGALLTLGAYAVLGAIAAITLSRYRRPAATATSAG